MSAKCVHNWLVYRAFLDPKYTSVWQVNEFYCSKCLKIKDITEVKA